MRGPTQIQRMKERLGFLPANQRPACRNCTHSRQQFNERQDAYPWWCNKGLFGTTAQAVCLHHQPQPKEGSDV